jgi:putative spermidine/putrescine transport system ATP-binding protein
MFRPEDLKIAVPGSGNFRAQVVTAFFLGDHVRLVLDTGAEGLVIARISERRNFVKGETLEFTLDPQTLVSLED